MRPQQAADLLYLFTPMLSLPSISPACVFLLARGVFTRGGQCNRALTVQRRAWSDHRRTQPKTKKTTLATASQRASVRAS